MSSDNAVVITGMGCVSPLGFGVPALWDGLLAGRSALKPVTLFDASAFRNPLAGQVDGVPAPDAADPAPRAVKMLCAAAREALADALGLPGATPEALRARAAELPGFARAGLVTGTNFGGMSAVETALTASAGNLDAARLDRYLFGSAADAVAALAGCSGPRLTLSLSCASGTAALGTAFDLIRTGRADVALACGYDELSLYIYAGLSALRAMTSETIRPFDTRRKGTLFSEGAGVLVLERASHAAARGARSQARILGRYMNNDGYHMTAPETEAKGIRTLMRAALADASVTPEQIDHLNLHATGTPYNDAIETVAVMDVFGSRGSSIPVTSVKSAIGHTMGAAGSIETIAAVCSLRDGAVPPIQGLEPEHKDPACTLNTPTGAPLRLPLRHILKTSYGFGGTNAAVVLAAPLN